MTPSPFETLEAAEAYARWYSSESGARQAAAEQAVLSEVLAAIGGHSALEIGCGTGFFTGWIASLGYEVCGLDPSQAMLQVVHREGVPARLVRGSGLCLPFKSRRFDVVLALTVAEFVPDCDLLFTEMVRVAARGVVVAALNRWHPRSLQRKLKALKGKGSFADAHFFTVPELLRRLQRAGLRTGLRLRLDWRSALPWRGEAQGPGRQSPFDEYLVVWARLD